MIWFTVFFIGLFLNIISIYVNASDYCESTACLIFYVVNGFGIILDAAFLWFWFLKCKHYWKKWCALNQDWFIDGGEDIDDASMHVRFVQGCPVWSGMVFWRISLVWRWYGLTSVEEGFHVDHYFASSCCWYEVNYCPVLKELLSKIIILTQWRSLLLLLQKNGLSTRFEFLLNLL